MFGIVLKTEGLEAYYDFLTKVESNSSLGAYSYEPTIIVVTYSITKEQVTDLLFAGFA